MPNSNNYFKGRPEEVLGSECKIYFRGVLTVGYIIGYDPSIETYLIRETSTGTIKRTRKIYNV